MLFKGSSKLHNLTCVIYCVMLFFSINERLEDNDSSFEKAKECSSRSKLLSKLQKSTLLRSEE